MTRSDGNRTKEQRFWLQCRARSVMDIRSFTHSNPGIMTPADPVKPKFSRPPFNGIAQIRCPPEARSKAQTKSAEQNVSQKIIDSSPGLEAEAMTQGSALVGLNCCPPTFLLPVLPLMISSTGNYSISEDSEEPGVAKSGKRCATLRFSTLNDPLSTSAKVTRPKKSSRICTRSPADKVLTTMPENPIKTPSAMLTSEPGITPSSTTIGSSDSKHCFNSTIASSGTAGILCPKCTKLLMPVTCLIS